MGKKRERKLREDIECLIAALDASDSALANERRAARIKEDERRAFADKTVREALADMRDWFAIVTKSGHVVRAKAVGVTTSCEVIDATSPGASWTFRVPGPGERRATIIVEPIKTGE